MEIVPNKSLSLSLSLSLRRKMPGPPIALVWATSNKWQFTGHQYQIPLVWATRNRYPCMAHQCQIPATLATNVAMSRHLYNTIPNYLNWIQFKIHMRLFRAQTCAPAAHDCALGGAPERRGAFGPRPAARDPKRCIRAVRATKIERTRTADMRSLARAANQRGEGARLVGGQAPWSQFLRGDNSWPLGSNGTCTVALTKRLDHMK